MDMRKLMFFISLITFFCISCQKEFSIESGETDLVRGNIGLLSKVIVTYLPDSLDYLSHEYFYDTAKRVNRIVTTQKSRQSGGVVTEKTKAVQFQRDNYGRIVRITSFPDTSSYYTVFLYDNAPSNKVVSATVYQRTGYFSVLITSTLFEYNTSNRVLRTSQYYPQATNSLKLTAYQTYLYDSRGNIIEKQLYQDDLNNGTLVPSLRYRWEYDNRINPRYQKEVALFYWDANWPTTGSPSNAIKQLNYYPNSPNDELLNTFQYDSKGRPLFELRKPDATNITKYFYY